MFVLKVDRRGRRDRREERRKANAKDNAETRLSDGQAAGRAELRQSLRLLMYPPPGCPVVAFGISDPRYFGKRGCK